MDDDEITITLSRDEAHALLYQWAIGECQYAGRLGRDNADVCERAREKVARLLGEPYERTL